jgi:hypothetical protein
MEIDAHVEGDDLVIRVDDEETRVPLFLIESWDKYYGDEIPEDSNEAQSRKT